MDLTAQAIEISFFPVGEPIYFPHGKASNVVRGALGLALEALGRSDRSCEQVCAAVYGRRESAEGPSGFQDPPRPIVVRTEELDGREFRPGERVSLAIHSFAPQLPIVWAVQRAFERLAKEGLGRNRTRFDGLEMRLGPPVTLSLRPGDGVRRMAVTFVTPTELKSGGIVLRDPEFATLFARARDRVSLLRSTFQGGPLAIDFERLGVQALEVKRVGYAVDRSRAVRHSARTEQSHFLQGFLGRAEYEGPLTELAPFLKACEWTGVGRQTVWGHGALRVEMNPGLGCGD